VAATSWPDAAIAMAGILFVTVIVAVAVWQVFATGQTSIASKGESRYRALAERAIEREERTPAKLDELTVEVGELGTRAGELERLLKDVG
jgi:hypothetical protein